MRSLSRLALVALVSLLLPFWACSPNLGGGDGDADVDADGDGDGDAAACLSTEPYCSPSGTQVLVCHPEDGTVEVVETCAEGEACLSGDCRPVVCIPGERECVDEHSERFCREDGSGWDERPCEETMVCLEEDGACAMPCILRVFILLDRSGSMGTEVGTSTKWQQAREALAALFELPSAGEVEFGLGVFPSGGGSCDTSEQLVYPVPEATAANVEAYFDEHEPSGDTPLQQALARHLEDIGANLGDRAYSNFLLLVSDGNDTCYDERCIEECGIFNVPCIIACESRAEDEVVDLLGETSARLRDERAIRTFVIGFGEGVRAEELEAIAASGGTVLGRWLPASDVSELGVAFETILSEMLECNPIVY